MKSVTHAYSSERECLLQEAVHCDMLSWYIVMPELWYRKLFPAVVNVNINMPENRVKMMLTKNRLYKLIEDSIDIYKTIMVSQYIIRPQDQVFNQICYAYFAKNYQLLPNQTENHSQPNELSDEVIEWCYISAEQKRINRNDIIVRKNKWVSIRREKASIYINKVQNNIPSHSPESVSTYVIMGMFSS